MDEHSKLHTVTSDFKQFIGDIPILYFDFLCREN